MPNRILRDCTDSIPVNSVSVHAERLFYRLIMKVDDFGRLVANPKLLRPLLFPLLLDEVREADLQRWIAECVKAGLVRLYEVNEKQYLEIQNFKQRTRAKHSKFPTPAGEGPAHDGHMTVTCPPHDGHMLTETETETETTTCGVVDLEKPPDPRGVAEAEAVRFAKSWISANCPSFLRSAPAVFARLVVRLGRDEAVRQVTEAQADPNVGNPFAYLEAKLDAQKARAAPTPSQKPRSQVLNI